MDLSIISAFVTPVIFLVIVFIVVIFVGQAQNKKKVEKNHICAIVTKSRELIVSMYPKASGSIKAPPNKLFSDNSENKRIYAYNRKFSLHLKYPIMASGLSKLMEVDAYASIYEEGDPSPILPSDEEPIQTPERVGALTGQNIIPQILGGLRDQFGGGSGGLNLGKNKTLVLIMLGLVVLCVMVAGYAGIQMLQFIPFATNWMSLR